MLDGGVSEENYLLQSVKPHAEAIEQEAGC